MIFGISTTVLRERPVSYALQRIAAAGYRSAEVWLWHLERFPEHPLDVAARARSLGLQLTFHAPAGDLNPLHSDPQQARYAQSQVLDSLQVARDLGARTVAVHPGHRTEPDDALESLWGRLLDWAIILDEAAQALDLGIGLELMEATPLEFFTHPADAARLMGQPLSRLGLTVDLAHLNTHGHPSALLAELEPAWIYHAHLSDNAPHRVHLPLERGDMDLGAALEALGRMYQGIVSLEGSRPGLGEALLGENRAALQKLGLML